MAIENTTSLRKMTESEEVRRDGMRRRVLSAEWTSSSVIDLINNLTKLSNDETTPTSRNNTMLSMEEALLQCNHIEISGEIAANSMGVVSEEVLQLSKEMADIDACVAKEEVEVQRLRNVLIKERKIVDYRKQLEGIASVILQLPPRQEILKRLQHLRSDCDSIDDMVEKLEQNREILKKELALLTHTAESVKQTAKQLSSLVRENGGHGDSDDNAGKESRRNFVHGGNGGGENKKVKVVGEQAMDIS